MAAAGTRERLAAFFALHTCEELDRLARERDLPLHALPD
jgi:hypothetical protein